jgi:predicted transcriptional regulator
MTPRPRRPEPKPDEKKRPKRDQSRWNDLNQFIDVTMRELTPAQTAVWLTLFRDERKGVAKSAQAYIAERCGLSRESVSRAINELQRRGLVQTLHQGGLNQGLSWYRVKALNKG